MPRERRLIRFSRTEVEAALRRFAETQERTLPNGGLLSVDYHPGGAEGVGVSLSFDGNGGRTWFTALETAAALIAHCRKVKVPIPRQGQKSVRLVDGELTLQIDLSPPQ
jgi:hypothetical protein